MLYSLLLGKVYFTRRPCYRDIVAKYLHADAAALDGHHYVFHTAAQMCRALLHSNPFMCQALVVKWDRRLCLSSRVLSQGCNTHPYHELRTVPRQAFEPSSNRFQADLDYCHPEPCEVRL